MMEWLTSQPWDRYWLVLTTVVTGASGLLLAVSKITKTDWDDSAAKWLQKVLGYLSLAPKKQLEK